MYSAHVGPWGFELMTTCLEGSQILCILVLFLHPYPQFLNFLCLSPGVNTSPKFPSMIKVLSFFFITEIEHLLVVDRAMKCFNVYSRNHESILQIPSKSCKCLLPCLPSPIPMKPPASASTIFTCYIHSNGFSIATYIYYEGTDLQKKKRG